MKKRSNVMQLKMLGLPVIDSLDDFSALTHFSKKFIYACSKNSQHYYKVYELPKKSGGKRTIAQPCYTLKALQSWILNNILVPLSVSKACKGFERGTSILDNAKPHVGANAILTIDLENFFPSVRADQVCQIFKTIGYSPRIAAILTSICTYQAVLPQGSPCSPKLANLVCLRLDARMQGYVGKRNVVYTRYADDLSFSSYSPGKLLSIFSVVKKIVISENFRLNDNKTRVCGPSRPKKVTGLIVNDTKAGIGRTRLREIRAKIHQLTKPNSPDNIQKDVNHIKGWLAFIKSVDKDRWKILDTYIQKLKLQHVTSNINLL